MDNTQLMFAGVLIAALLFLGYHFYHAKKATTAAAAQAANPAPQTVLHEHGDMNVNVMHSNDPANPVPGAAIAASGTAVGQAISAVAPAGFVLSEGADRSGAAKSDVVGIFLGGSSIPATGPAVPGRALDVDGPKIATLMSDTATYPGGASDTDRIARWYVSHPEVADYAQAYRDVIEGKDLGKADQALAAGQAQRDADANVAGKDFHGVFPVGEMSVLDMQFVLDRAPQYAAIQGKNLREEAVYGTANAVNALTNLAASTNAGQIGTFVASDYHGPLESVVAKLMNGG